MGEKVLSIDQLRRARKFREAFIRTTDVTEPVPSLAEFGDLMNEIDHQRDQERIALTERYNDQEVVALEITDQPE